jgi:hypothetical protein
MRYLPDDRTNPTSQGQSQDFRLSMRPSQGKLLQLNKAPFPHFPIPRSSSTPQFRGSTTDQVETSIG